MLSLSTTANAHTNTNGPATCDGLTVQSHVHRARVLLREAYSEERAKVGPLDAYHRHRQCVEVKAERKKLGELRDRLKAAFAADKVEGAYGDIDPPGAAYLDQLGACESGGDYTTNTGNGFYGKFQFDLGTWQSVGGSGLPSDASPAEQDYRAALLYRERGSAPWPTCG